MRANNLNPSFISLGNSTKFTWNHWNWNKEMWHSRPHTIPASTSANTSDSAHRNRILPKSNARTNDNIQVR